MHCEVGSTFYIVDIASQIQISFGKFVGTVSLRLHGLYWWILKIYYWLEIGSTNFMLKYLLDFLLIQLKLLLYHLKQKLMIRQNILRLNLFTFSFETITVEKYSILLALLPQHKFGALKPIGQYCNVIAFIDEESFIKSCRIWSQSLLITFVPVLCLLFAQS